MRCTSCEPDYCACADFYAGRMQHWKGELMDDDLYLFPQREVRSMDGRFIQRAQPGLSLRDFFAAQALAGMGTWLPVSPSSVQDLTSHEALRLRAEWAYRQADEMLAAA